jgi:hypothetical protein
VVLTDISYPRVILSLGIIISYDRIRFSYVRLYLEIIPFVGSLVSYDTSNGIGRVVAFRRASVSLGRRGS